MSEFVIYDLEFTCWDNVREFMWMHGTQRREIIQIGALRVNRKTLDVVEEFDVLVKPTINPHLSDYCVNLTGITQEMIDAHGLDFGDAYERFNVFCKPPVTAYAYGNDVFVLGENVGMKRVHCGDAFNRHGIDYMNIAPFLRSVDPDLRSVNSGRLWQHFGAPKPDGVGEHNALFDCYSILAALHVARERGLELPF